jgi:transposase
MIIFITMTYSLDFRQKVLSIKEQEGLTQAETAVRFGVGAASITRWNKQLDPQHTRKQ